jgi:site-specific DNA-methyltransferase (adenine-specific)
MNRIIHGDCLEIMPTLDIKVDMILADLPYGTTACKWDTIIPFEPLWEQYKRIIKDNGAIVLTASQPFTSALVMSNVKMFKYEWIWEKHQGTNPMLVKISPLKSHENILVFAKEKTVYNPQMTKGMPYSGFISEKTQSEVYGGGKSIHRENKDGTRYPKTVLKFTKDKGKRFHPTQKPVELCEYLIKTYTNENELVLDNCAGSGTTAIAAIRTKRNWICIEQDENYCEIGRKRVEDELRQKPLL